MAENMNPFALMAERDQVFKDYYSNIVPTRMPVMAAVVPLLLAGAAGQDPLLWQYDGNCLLGPMEEWADKIYSDTNPFSPPVMMMRPAYPYQVLGSQSFVLGPNGQVQHPEVSGMPAEDYDELIERGFDYLVEKVVPRQYHNLDLSDPVKMTWAAMLENTMTNNANSAFFPAYMEFSFKKGYHQGGSLGSGGSAEAPLDFLADQLRGFSHLSVDIRRRRQQVIDACEVLTPLMQKMGMPAVIDYQANIFYPLHMPTFMRPKDVEEIYMPSYRKLLRDNVARGIRPYIFVEDDWTGILDILHDEFPAGCMLQIDEGDPKLFKEKLGKKFLLSGMFPLETMRNNTTENILARAKDFLDIMLPGGEYTFGFGKNPLQASDMNMDQYAALTHFVHENSYYPNAGEKFGTPLNAEGFQPVAEWDAPIKSRYILSWEDFKKANPYTPDYALPKFAAADHQVFLWYMNLLF